MSDAIDWHPLGAKGPWHVGPVDDTVVTAFDGSEIAAIDGDYNAPDTWPTMELHARAIAEVPAMVMALREVERIMPEDDNERGALCDSIRAILSRIDGGAA